MMGCLLVVVGLALALLVGVPISMDGLNGPPVPVRSPGASELVVARGSGGMWSVVATVDGGWICMEVRTRGGGGRGCSMRLPSGAISLATGSVSPPIAHGIVREDVDRVHLELIAGRRMDADLVSLEPIGLDAKAFVARVPRFEDIVWFVATDRYAHELGRAAGPAGPQPSFGPQPTAEALELPASTGPLLCGVYRVTIEGREADRTTMERTRDVVTARLSGLGISDPVVELDGEAGLRLESAGDEAWLRDIIVAPGSVAFVPVPPELDELVEDGQPVPHRMADDEPLFGGEGIASARAVIDEPLFADEGQPGQPSVDLTLTPDAARTFDDHAENHQGERFAIVIDGVVHSAPAINARDFGGEARITGGTLEDVVVMAALLASGPLPAQVEQLRFGPCDDPA